MFSKRVNFFVVFSLIGLWHDELHDQLTQNSLKSTNTLINHTLTVIVLIAYQVYLGHWILYRSASPDHCERTGLSH